jgi:protein O-GlcNAc transferase
VLALQAGKPDAGLPYLLAALEANPAQEQYWLSYANALLMTGQAGKAQGTLDAAMQRGVGSPALQALRQQAAAARNTPAAGQEPSAAETAPFSALFGSGDCAGMERAATALLERYPASGSAWKALGVALIMQRKNALAALQKAAEMLPHDAEVHSDLGNALKDLGQLDEAAASCRRAPQINPDFAEAHNSLGNVLRDQGKLDEAVESFHRALASQPDSAEVYSNLGRVLADQRKTDEADEHYRKALALKPDSAEIYSNLLFLYGYNSAPDSGEYLSLARGWEQACVPAHDLQQARGRVFQRTPLAGRRLKVGYVSGDYRGHAVSYFIEQLFACHDRARVELFAYSNNGMRDAVTARLQALAEHWRHIVGMPDTAVIERMEADKIDVLIDLSGHTGHSRLKVFARRAAPVQAHYLGYFASTGLTEMDSLIGDTVLTPPEADSHFCERVWRLPRARASYQGADDAPEPGWQPGGDGGVWLGSFNNLGKITAQTLGLWARVLHALPKGRLLLKNKGLADAGNWRHILKTMTGHGVTPERIELQDSGVTPGWREHMAYYDRLDIMLDSIGAHGGYTTACDALWMAVPVIAIAGDHMATRMAASILDAIGHPEWIARTEDEYIEKVVALARDAELRRLLRASQRDRMAASPLCDAQGLAVSLEHAYFEMFERWAAMRRRSDAPTTQ